MKRCTNLRYLRLKHGISLRELADAAGVSGQYMSRVELGQVIPSWTLEKKCEAALEQIALRRFEAAQALVRDRQTAGLLLNPPKEDGNGI